MNLSFTLRTHTRLSVVILLLIAFSLLASPEWTLYRVAPPRVPHTSFSLTNVDVTLTVTDEGDAPSYYGVRVEAGYVFVNGEDNDTRVTSRITLRMPSSNADAYVWIDGRRVFLEAGTNGAYETDVFAKGGQPFRVAHITRFTLPKEGVVAITPYDERTPFPFRITLRFEGVSTNALRLFRSMRKGFPTETGDGVVFTGETYAPHEATLFSFAPPFVLVGQTPSLSSNVKTLFTIPIAHEASNALTPFPVVRAGYVPEYVAGGVFAVKGDTFFIPDYAGKRVLRYSRKGVYRGSVPLQAPPFACSIVAGIWKSVAVSVATESDIITYYLHDGKGSVTELARTNHGGTTPLALMTAFPSPRSPLHGTYQGVPIALPGDAPATVTNGNAVYALSLDEEGARMVLLSGEARTRYYGPFPAYLIGGAILGVFIALFIALAGVRNHL